MVLVSCEANALGCFTAATPIGHLAFQCTPGLDRRHQCEPRLKLENVIARMRHNSSGISCSGNGEDDPGTRRNVDAQQLTWHTAAGHEKGAGEGGGRRAPLFGGKAEFIDESSQSSSTWRRGASDHLHPSRAALAPGRIAAAVSLVGGAESVRSVFKEGPVKRRHHQQQRQRDDAAVGAHAGRRVAEGLGRNGGRQNRSTMSAAVEVTGGGAASTSDKWNWRSRLSQSVYQQQQVGRQQIQRYGILPRGLGYTSIGRRTGGGGGHGTAMSMSSGTGSGDGSVEQPHPLGDTAGDGGSNGNGGLGGEAARAGDEQSTYFAIEREGEQAWPLEGTSPAAAARDRSSKARRRPTTAEKARQQGASAGRSAEIFSSLSLPFGSPQAETTATPASLEEGIKNRRSRGSDGDIWGPADAEIRLDAEEGGESAKADAGPIAESYERGRWLLGLLVLQSTSSSVLDKYQVIHHDFYRRSNLRDALDFVERWGTVVHRPDVHLAHRQSGNMCENPEARCPEECLAHGSKRGGQGCVLWCAPYGK